jgi:hypothetical protein
MAKLEEKKILGGGLFAGARDGASILDVASNSDLIQSFHRPYPVRAGDNYLVAFHTGVGQ